jgi:hypothetical protein
MCIEEEKEKATEINRFVGFREMHVPINNTAV